MFQNNSFPRNILAALDALVELGKLIHIKNKGKRVVRIQSLEESGKEQHTSIKAAPDSKGIGK